MDRQLSRRDFLKATGGAASVLLAAVPVRATPAARTLGANDRIRIGIIGCGSRGIGTHLAAVHQHAQAANLDVVAVADPWRVAREQAAAKVKEWFGHEPKQCRTHRELLDLPEVDAVMIASCDHHHASQLEVAARSGRHVYVEKPVGIEMAALVRACDAVREAGVIVQCGTQLRSMAGLVGAQAVVAAGRLGRISRIEQVRNGDKPYWYPYLKPDVKKEDLDWDEFTGGRTKKPFDPILYSGWYGHYEFSQGPVPQWGVHFLDSVNFIADLGTPETCTCLAGTYSWKDEHAFTAPDQVHALWHYPKGVMVSYTTNFGNSSGNLTRILGDQGTLKLDNMGAPEFSAEGGVRRDGSIRGVVKVEPIERPDHFLDWFQCMRSGAKPHASIETGFQHSVASIMACLSHETGRRTRYDAATRTVSAS